MFYFPRYALADKVGRVIVVHTMGFPHSDISGSKVARHLPETFRRQAASFIASMKPRHPPYALKIPIRNSKNYLRDLSPKAWERSSA